MTMLGVNEVHAIADRLGSRIIKHWDAGNWRERAACDGLDPGIFFPAGEENAESLEQIERAREICNGCPVREACLMYAIANAEYGIYGGLTEDERRRVRRRMRYVIENPTVTV